MMEPSRSGWYSWEDLHNNEPFHPAEKQNNFQLGIEPGTFFITVVYAASFPSCSVHMINMLISEV